MKENKILRVFLNNAHHTGNYYTTAPTVFSMERRTLINEIIQFFTLYVTLIKRKHDLRYHFLGFRFISTKMVGNSTVVSLHNSHTDRTTECVQIILMMIISLYVCLVGTKGVATIEHVLPFPR